jgi:tRNA 2-thiocytidine biosynthesis protein TtcA
MLQIESSGPESNPAAAAERLRAKLARTVAGAVTGYGLVEDGDRILVALSGGKDSYTMLDMLLASRRKAPVRFELIAYHLDQVQPGYDGRPLETWLQATGVPFHIDREDTYSVVMSKADTRGGRTYCRVCSRLRRGIMYTTAARLGCNKIALGHHRDDALETLLLNLFYSGKLQAMPAVYTTDDGRFEVIRPLIECAESDIARHAANEGYPILPCNLCGSQNGLKRDRIKRLLEQLEAEIPNVRQVMLAAVKNVRASHLLDPALHAPKPEAVD